MYRTRPGTPPAFARLTMIGVALIAMGGCSNIERAAPRPQSSRSSAVAGPPQMMRGTIASEAVVVGYSSVESPTYRPVIAQGYGFVVGLDGTGSRDIGPELRAQMLSEMARGGIGSARTGNEHISPQAMLDSLDTAVVVVKGIVPQAATKGTHFDVLVEPVPGTSTTSLEGGVLYTVDLHPDLNLGRRSGDTFPIAKAKGPIFINPFSEPGNQAGSTISGRVGRILDGGVVLKDMPLKLRLINPSHARAGMLVTAINTRFTQEAGQRDPTARGESDELIDITVPPSFRDRIDEFMELMLHTTIRQSRPESVAVSIRRILEANPSTTIAADASWRWQALGPKALPTVRELYDYPEEKPRMAAIVAGARLSDPLAVPKLVDEAISPSSSERLRAIVLLRGMGLNPLVDRTLRKLVSDEDVNVRLAAYEALALRGDPTIQHITVDDKFLVDVVESDATPIVYVTQIGLPRIALLGTDLAIDVPVTLQAWSNRLMLKGDPGDSDVEVYYRPSTSDQGYISRVDPQLGEFIRFLGHTTTVDNPEPGLGLTYGETVGLLYQICSTEYVKADFRAQQDRILAAIVAQNQGQTVVNRPDVAEPDQPAAVAPASSGKAGQPGERPASSPGRQ